MRDALPKSHEPDHLGLAYGPWAPTAENGKIDDNARARWLSKLVKRSISPDYTHAFNRWRSSFGAPGDRTLEVTLQSRLLVGHGNPSATDVGLTLHHTWGVPVIPGSALKGLVAHYIDAVYGPDDPDRASAEQSEAEAERARYQGVMWNDRRIRRGPGDIYRALFGAPDADEDRELREHDLPAGAQRGRVMFHDALYVPMREQADCPFAADVLTVHQKGYYNAEGKRPPNDYDGPNPVSFLSVRPGVQMLLAVSGPADWTEFAQRLLVDSLAAWGVGGKTSSGYGRLTPSAAPGAVRMAAGAGASPQPPRRAHQRGDRITVTRVDDSKGKARFRTTDGVLGDFAGEPAPSIGIGESVEAWITNVGQNIYTLTRREDIAARHAKPARGTSTPSAGSPKGRRR